MKRLPLILILFFFCHTFVFADMNPEEIRQINQRLETILRESRDLPQQKKICITSEVKSIQKLLNIEVDENKQSDEKRDPSENRVQPSDPYKTDMIRLSAPRLYDEKSFNELKVRIKRAWPYRDQLVLIKRLNKNSSFTVDQIVEITKLLDFPNDQKEVAIILLPNAVDLENVDHLYGLFWTLSDKEKINRIADENLH